MYGSVLILNVEGFISFRIIDVDCWKEENFVLIVYYFRVNYCIVRK